jgi:hypothetical protein
MEQVVPLWRLVELLCPRRSNAADQAERVLRIFFL